MKYLFLFTILFSNVAIAKSYTFSWRFKDTESVEYLNLTVKNLDRYESAYEKATQFCFDHFKNQKEFSRERWLDIIDVCANPTSKWGQ